MQRRIFLKSLPALLALPALARAQAKKVSRLGWLSTASEKGASFFTDPFFAGMRDIGYEVKRDFIFDMRHAGDDVSRLPALAAELISLKPDLLLGIGTACQALAAKTSKIPIVITATTDPLRLGLVKSLARPGTNVTGIANFTLIGKHVELLLEASPTLTRVVLLNDASTPSRATYERMAREAAEEKGRRFSSVDAKPTPEGIRAAFVEAGLARDAGIVVTDSSQLMSLRATIVEELRKARVPSISRGLGREQGTLISYGSNLQESFRKEVPPLVAQILKGANPAETPIHQSTRFELVIDLKTAKELGVTISPSILARATRIVE